MNFFKRNLKRFILEGLGWLLVIGGIAALVLPGPGLLALFAGMTLLATRYEWAERRLEPIRRAALKAGHDSVSSWPHILLSVCSALSIVMAGIIWGVHPTVPDWWPLADKWWLPGGWSTGTTMIGSGLTALGMIIVSFIKFRNSKS